ncbi:MULTISPECIES: glycosyltransferase family 2 protein [Protofrankia]|uniref:Glycosyl transferase family 2 n=1 Tax=Candidatus Protofrankia datiscae TaxID=2716812 RepID=F8B0F9_9ACTN|nr:MULTISPECIES: glycosyltransferase family 2 protein [Protofrankia]AEH09708.1 glycosyl transferase family 2 [Candidatus Protofrankia datiscae]
MAAENTGTAGAAPPAGQRDTTDQNTTGRETTGQEAADRETTGAETVDVVISTYDEERHVGRCLDAVLAQDYPAELVRIWLVDGGSRDRTVAIADERAAADQRLTVIADGQRRALPTALNLAIRLSTNDLVAKVDAHGYPERDFLRRAVAVLRDGPSDVACVGGRPRQHGDTRFGAAAALARTSHFGVGDSGYAGRTEHAFVDTVQCGVYRRAALERVGLFDPDMVYGEDEELNWRLRRAGYRIVLDTSIGFHYLARPSWRAVFRQYYRYGRARVRVCRAHHGMLRPRHLAPASFLLALVGLAGASACASRTHRAACATGTRAALAVAVLAYSAAASLSAAMAVGRARRDGPVPDTTVVGGRPDGFPVMTARVMACFGALHAGYALGTLRGVLDRPRRPG